MPQGQQAPAFDPDAFHQQFIGAEAPKEFDPDDFHQKFTSKAPDNRPEAQPGAYQTKPGAPVENVNKPPDPTPLERVGEITTGSRHPFHDTAVDLRQWRDNPAQKAGQLVGDTARVLPRMAESVLYHPIDTAVNMTGGKQFSEDVDAGRGWDAAADVAAGAVNVIGPVALGGPEAMRATGDLGAAAISKVGDVASSAAEKIRPTTPLKARGMYERGVAPSGMSAEDQQLMRENWQRGQKYIANETRNYPITKGSGGDVVTDYKGNPTNKVQQGGAMNSAGVAKRAGDNLWTRTVEPVVDAYREVQRPGNTIGNSIRGSFTELDRQTRSGAVNAGEELAKYFDGKTLTVGQMQDFVTQLNNDKAVSRFYDMSPNEQVAAELGDPSLRGKVATVQALREAMFDAIGETGGEQLGDTFREARKDWGALRSIENQVRGARVPTPQPVWTRLANTVRGSLNMKGTDFWLRGSDTLFNFNNPDRLVPKAFNALGETDLEPPSAPEISPITVGGVPSRQLPPAGGSQPSNPRAVPGVRDPSFEGRPYGDPLITPPPIEVQPNATRVMTPVSAGPGEGPSADLRNSGGAASTIKPRIGSVQNVEGPPPTDALATVPVPGPITPTPTTPGRPPYMPGPPIDAEFEDIPRDLQGNGSMPSSGRTMVTPRPAVEIMPDLPALNAGPPQPPGPPQLVNGLPQRALPPIDPRHPVTGAIQLGPSDVPPETGPPPEPAGRTGPRLPRPKAAPAKKAGVEVAKPEESQNDRIPQTAAASVPEPVTMGPEPDPNTPDWLQPQNRPPSVMPETPKPDVANQNIGVLSKIKNPRETANPAGMPVDYKPIDLGPSKIAEGNLRDDVASQPLGEDATEQTPTSSKKSKREPRETIDESFDEDTRQQAHQEIVAMNEQWQAFPRPGRFFSGDADLGGRYTPKELTHSINSARPQMEMSYPWLKNLPKMTAERLRAAIESGKGVEYNRLMNEAGRAIHAAKQEAGPLIESYGTRLEDAAKSVESIDPDLSRVLRDIKGGKWSGVIGLAKFIEDNLDAAEAASTLSEAIGQLSEEELSESPENGDRQGTGARAEDQQEPPAVIPERRSPANSERRSRVSEMSPEEMRRELMTSQTTDLPNRRAFDEGNSPTVGMSDADGLKALNDKFGYDAGNALLKAKADALKEAGLDAYHDKGDEFLYRGDTPEELNEKLENAREILRNRVITFTKSDGSTIQFKGADFSYGTDTELAGAEKELKSNKAQREARGERARGELRGVVEVGPPNGKISQGRTEGSQKGPQVIPGLEDAVAENKKMAAVELGKKLTEKINEPPKSIESAAGEMESMSPLFRGTSASPQNEMFAPGGTPKEPTNADFERQAHDAREQVRNHEKVSPNKYAMFQRQEESAPRTAKERASFWKRTLENVNSQAK